MGSQIVQSTPPHRTCVFSCAAKPRRMSLKRNLRFSGTGFFFLKGFTVVFHRKKLFRFCFNYVFFLKGFTLFFPHKKSFFVFFLITFFLYIFIISMWDRIHIKEFFLLQNSIMFWGQKIYIFFQQYFVW